MENTKSNTLMTFLDGFELPSHKSKVEVVKAFLFLGEKLKTSGKNDA